MKTKCFGVVSRFGGFATYSGKFRFCLGSFSGWPKIGFLWGIKWPFLKNKKNPESSQNDTNSLFYNLENN